MRQRWKDALPILNKLMKDIEEIQNCDFDHINATEEERRLASYISKISCSRFDDVPSILSYALKTPSTAKGRLVLQSNGRYCIGGTDIEFSCGMWCEIYVPYHNGWEEGDDEDPCYTWVGTAVEYSDGGYYFTARPRHPMANALVRV